MISGEELYAMLHEQDQEKRDTMIDTLSEEEAKYILKCYADFFNRRSGI